MRLPRWMRLRMRRTISWVACGARFGCPEWAQLHQGKHVWDSRVGAVVCPPMTETPKVFRRHGPNRDARRAMRAAPLPDHLRPVRPGMHGGRYRPLSDDDILRIHRSALRLLAEVGLADAPPSGVEILLRAG